MKRKKIKIITVSLICAAILSAGAFAAANASENVQKTNDSESVQTIESTFRNISEKAGDMLKGGKHGGHFMFFDSSEIAGILGMTEDDFKAALTEADGNIVKILEDSGKLEEYKAKILENCKTKLDEQVADGKITQEQADEKYAETKAAVAGITSENSPIIRFRNGEKPEKGFSVHMFGGKGFDFSVESIADILGITEDELETKLDEADGNIIKILEDSGKLEEYKAKILENCKTKLDEQVADGKITQEKADELFARLEEMVNSFTSDSGFAMPGRGKGREHITRFKDDENSEDVTVTTKFFENKQTEENKSV
jgi:DNA-directed RNA polymerase specialized sigma subunit